MSVLTESLQKPKYKWLEIVRHPLNNQRYVSIEFGPYELDAAECCELAAELLTAAKELRQLSQEARS